MNLWQIHQSAVESSIPLFTAENMQEGSAGSEMVVHQATWFVINTLQKKSVGYRVSESQVCNTFWNKNADILK